MARLYIKEKEKDGKVDMEKTNIEVEGDVDLIEDYDTGEVHERTLLDDPDTVEVIESIQN